MLRMTCFLLVIMLAAGPCALPRDPTGEGQQGLLETRVALFEFHGSSQARGHIGRRPPGDLPEAALALAVHTGIRIGIEALAPQRHRRVVPIYISVQDRTIEQILRQMVHQDPQYEYRERLGVIEVLPVRAAKDPADCLNTAIPAFHVHYPWKIAWGQVLCEISIVSHDPTEIVPDPMVGYRCYGTSHSSHPPPQVLSVEFEQKPVRDVLDTLSTLAGNEAWSATYSQAPATYDNLRLAEYEPLTWYHEEKDPNKSVQALPEKCASCHYHQPAPKL